MTCLDDFLNEQLKKMHLFISIKNPAPIVTGAVEMRKKGFVWRATPEQAEKVRAKDYVAVFDGVRYSDTDDIAKVLRKGYFTMLREDWKPKDEPMFGDIPKGLLEAM